MSNDSDSTACANCGKSEVEHGVKLKRCTACKAVNYCNRECQMTHRRQHKKDCRKKADELLFEDPPPREECPLCMLPLPLDDAQSSLQLYCGKVICKGCVSAQMKADVQSGRGIQNGEYRELHRCPFCRNHYVEYNNSKRKERVKKLAENDNPI